MSPIGHCALGLALKPAAPKAPIWLLCAAAACADFLSMALFAIGVEGPVRGFPWSHGLLMSIVWSALAAALVFLCLRNARAALITGALVLSHWLLDFVSHPIPFDTFSWKTWHWTQGRPLPGDLPLFFGQSPRVGLGFYNSISAVQATAQEFAMLAAGIAIYIRFRNDRSSAANG